MFVPRITTGQGQLAPAHTQFANRVCYATWNCRILLRPYSELVEFKWGLGARDLAQEMLGRQLELLEKLHALVWRPIRHIRLALRFVQLGDKPLAIFLHAKAMAPSPQEARQNALWLWRQLQAIFPKDYVLDDASEGQSMFDIPFSSVEQPAIAVIYPFVGTLSQLTRQHFPGRVRLVFGNWAAALASHETVWRALHHAHNPALLDILIEPAFATKREMHLLDKLGGQLMQHNDENNPAAQTSATRRGTILRQRAQQLQRAYVAQLRLVTTNSMDALATSIGTSITTQNEVEVQPISAFHVAHVQENERAHWLHNIQALNFIPLEMPLSPAFQRLPFLATLPEAHAVFRMPVLSRGGIPALQMEYQSKISICNNTRPQ